ncbi:cold-shock protein [Nocardia beijingensis]
MTTTTSPTDRIPHLDPHTDTELPRWQHGHVAWFNTEKGFGYLTPDRGEPVFAEYRAITTPGYKTLTAGQPVIFTYADTPRGPEATQIIPYTRAGTTPRPATYRQRSDHGRSTRPRHPRRRYRP